MLEQRAEDGGGGHAARLLRGDPLRFERADVGSRSAVAYRGLERGEVVVEGLEPEQQIDGLRHGGVASEEEALGVEVLAVREAARALDVPHEGAEDAPQLRGGQRLVGRGARATAAAATATATTTAAAAATATAAAAASTSTGADDVRVRIPFPVCKPATTPSPAAPEVEDSLQPATVAPDITVTAPAPDAGPPVLVPEASTPGKGVDGGVAAGAIGAGNPPLHGPCTPTPWLCSSSPATDSNQRSHLRLTPPPPITPPLHAHAQRRLFHRSRRTAPTTITTTTRSFYHFITDDVSDSDDDAGG